MPRLSSSGRCFPSNAYRGTGIYTMCHACRLREFASRLLLTGGRKFTQCATLLVFRTLLPVWCLQVGGNLHNVPHFSSLGLCFSSGAYRGAGYLHNVPRVSSLGLRISPGANSGAGIYTRAEKSRGEMKIQDFKIQDFKISGFQDSGFQDFGISRFRISRFQDSGFQDFRISRFQDSRFKAET